MIKKDTKTKRPGIKEQFKDFKQYGGLMYHTNIHYGAKIFLKGIDKYRIITGILSFIAFIVFLFLNMWVECIISFILMNAHITYNQLYWEVKNLSNAIEQRGDTFETKDIKRQGLSTDDKD